VMKQNALEIIRPLIRDLISRDNDPGEIHICPNCNGALHVYITVYKEANRAEELSVGVHCEGCKTTGFFEYSEQYVPLWAKESKYKDMNVDDLWKLMRKKPGVE
jgi:hypothetical protein